MAKVKQTKETLKSIKHLVESFICGLECLNDTAELNDTMTQEMQDCLNKEWQRLKDGLEPSVQVNHAKTRPGGD